MGTGGIEPPSTGPKPEILSVKLCAHKQRINSVYLNYLLIYHKIKEYKFLDNCFKGM